MKLRARDQSDTKAERICDEFVATEFASLDEVLNTAYEFERDAPGHTCLISLDNLGQAQYTSMHAEMSHDLDSTDGHDLSNVDAAAFENGEHIGYLSTKSEFFIREQNFRAKATTFCFADACEKQLTVDDEELGLLEDLHKKPEAFIDRKVLIKVVPVDQPTMSICAFPNGYFSCDLNPFENYALAKHLEQAFGYRLFGIGASLIGFRRATKLRRATARKLGQDIATLYSRSGDSLFARRFSKLARSGEYLFLKYVEYLE